MSSSGSDVARLALLVCLMGAMCFYAYKSVLKFRDKKIAETVQRDFSDTVLEYPAVTVCASFRDFRFTPEKIVARAVANGTDYGDAGLGPDDIKKLSFERKDFVGGLAVAVENRLWDVDLSLDDAMWSEEFHEYEGGLCQTFAPVGTTLTGEVNSLYLRLENPPGRSYYEGCDVFRSDRCNERLSVFLHPKDAFVFNIAKKFAGRSMLLPELGKTARYTLTRKRFEKLDVEGDPCDADADVAGWKRCMLKHFDQRHGCALPWMVKEESQRACNVSTVHARLTSDERSLFWDIDTNLASRTGCKIPCRYDVYDADRVASAYEWNPPGSGDFAGIKLFYLEGVTVVHEEYESFDAFSLVGEVGGALGLFLGWSCFGGIDSLVRAIVNVLSSSTQPRGSRNGAREVD